MGTSAKKNLKPWKLIPQCSRNLKLRWPQKSLLKKTSTTKTTLNKMKTLSPPRKTKPKMSQLQKLKPSSKKNSKKKNSKKKKLSNKSRSPAKNPRKQRLQAKRQPRKSSNARSKRCSNSKLYQRNPTFIMYKETNCDASVFCEEKRDFLYKPNFTRFSILNYTRIF